MSAELYRLFGVNRFWANAIALRDRTQIAEYEQLQKGRAEYDGDEVRQAIVHARQDMVLLVSLLVDVNKQLRTVVWLMIAILALLAFLAAWRW